MKKKSSWWNKIGKSKHPESHEDVVPDAPTYVIEKPKEKDPYLEQIDELIDLLEPEVEPLAKGQGIQPLDPSGSTTRIKGEPAWEDHGGSLSQHGAPMEDQPLVREVDPPWTNTNSSL